MEGAWPLAPFTIIVSQPKSQLSIFFQVGWLVERQHKKGKK
jgi:hypothetical protein